MVQYQMLPHVFVVNQPVHSVQVYIVTCQLTGQPSTHAAMVMLAQSLMDQQKTLSIVHVELLHAMITMENFVMLKGIYVPILLFQIGFVQFVMVQLPVGLALILSAYVEIQCALNFQV